MRDRIRTIVGANYVASMGVVLLLILCMGGVWAYVGYSGLQADLEGYRKSFTDSQKANLREEIDQIFDYINFKRSRIEVEMIDRLRVRLDAACRAVEGVYGKFRSDLSTQEIRDIVTEALQPVHFESNEGYYFMSSLENGEIIFTGNQSAASDYQGTDSISPEHAILKEVTALVVENGEHFHRYFLPLPGEESEGRPKMALARRFDSLGIILGIVESVDSTEEGVKKEVLARIGNIRFGADGYVFIIDQDNVFLSHIDPYMLGGNFLSQFDQANRNVGLSLLSNATQPQGGFAQYEWIKPSTGRLTTKMSYVRNFDEWGWTIGTGTYLDDLELTTGNSLEQFRKREWEKVLYGIMLFFAAACVAAGVTKLFSRRIKQGVDTFTSFFERAAGTYEKIDVSKLSFEEFRTLARFANKMMDERRSIGLALESAKEEAEAGSRSKTQFLANMSHEMRTPLNGIMGMLQIMKLGPLTPDQEENVEIALTSSRSLLTIINDVLDLAQIESGNLQVRSEPLDVRAAVEFVMKSFRHQAEDKALDLDYYVDPKIPELVLGDVGRFRQVLFNLVGNSVKFTMSGKIRVEAMLISSQGDPCQHRMLFTVTDTGIGIPEDKIGLIFKPFTQVDGSHTRRYQGSGLGLDIVLRLVTLMGGSLSIESEEDQGTSVYFTIVVGSGDVERPDKDGALVAEDEKSRTLRILVAEDDRINRLTIMRFIQKLGHECVVVEQGEDVIPELKNGQYDCVFMDIQMPGMDGMETTRAVRGSHSTSFDVNIPIIAVTAHTMQGDRERFLTAGMNGFIAKPVDMQGLKRVLEDILFLTETE